MWIDLATFPDPPNHVTIKLDRTDDAVEFSGTPTTATRARASQTPGSRSASVLPVMGVFLKLMTYGTGIVFGLGLVCGLGVLGSVLVGNLPFTINGKPVGPGAAAGAMAIFLMLWIAIAILMFRAMRRMRSVLAVFSGAPAQRWRLRLDRNQIETSRGKLGQVAGGHRCGLEDVRRIVIAPDGCLLAEVADIAGQPASQIVLAGPLTPTDADWLAETLRRSLGLRG